MWIIVHHECAVSCSSFELPRYHRDEDACQIVVRYPCGITLRYTHRTLNYFMQHRHIPYYSHGGSYHESCEARDDDDAIRRMILWETRYKCMSCKGFELVSHGKGTCSINNTTVLDPDINMCEFYSPQQWVLGYLEEI